MSSSIPAANTALLALATTVLAGVTPAVQIVDSITGKFVSPEQFTLLSTTFTEQPQLLMGAAPEQFNQQFDMNCSVRTSSGGTSIDVAGLRVRALQMYGLIRDGLAADMSLGGVVKIAYCQSGTVEADVSGNGILSVECAFAVHVIDLA